MNDPSLLVPAGFAAAFTLAFLLDLAERRWPRTVIDPIATPFPPSECAERLRLVTWHVPVGDPSRQRLEGEITRNGFQIRLTSPAGRTISVFARIAGSIEQTDSGAVIRVWPTSGAGRQFLTSGATVALVGLWIFRDPSPLLMLGAFGMLVVWVRAFLGSSAELTPEQRRVVRIIRDVMQPDRPDALPPW